MNVSVARGTLVILTQLFRDVWSCAGGSGNSRGYKNLPLQPTTSSKFHGTLLRCVLEFIERVEQFAIERVLSKDLVLNTPTVVSLLREKLLDFRSVTPSGGWHLAYGSECAELHL